ncbi:MAG TPA: flagellar basal body P-ring protein FlgI [Thermotogota bacterium]|nr:flagellar basal body P-ring protein FlgI [Thermotogota bacterium]HRW92901.1 flagellar basal body P-ring protein FlgI [Thermotogota bacterium]
MKKILLVSLILLLGVGLSLGALVRLKDIARFRGARDNQLFGVGLVVGLDGTGDSGSVPSTLLSNMLKNFGIAVTQSDLESENTALVMVTADIPPFFKEGMRLDVQVSSIGDAQSLANGVLLQTPLYGADGVVYAVAQGQLSLGGDDVKSSINLQTRYPVVATMPGGAIVEKEIPTEIVDANSISLLLLNPDFTTAARVSQALNTRFGESISRALDASTIKVKVPDVFVDDLITFLSIVEEVEVVPDVVARVVINERTGTIVMGGEVKVDDFSVSYGGFNITIRNGMVTEGDNPGPESSIQNLITALKAVGATPQDIVAVVQAMKDAGVLHAQVIMM